MRVGLALSDDPTTFVAFGLRQKVVVPFTIGMSSGSSGKCVPRFVKSQ